MKSQQITIKITPQKYRGLLLAGYSLEQLYILLLVKKGLDIKVLNSTENERAILQSVMRKQLINDKTYELLPEGNKLINYIESSDEVNLVLPKSIDRATDDFDKWWKAYPSTDTIIRNKKVLFKGSRSLKKLKEKCRELYNKIIISQEYTPQQLLDAVKYEVGLKIDKSVRERKNNMIYMSNTHAYLHQRQFEAFIEEAEIINDEGESIPNNTGIVGI